MKRPIKWHYLPYNLMEYVAENADLEYDSYESSKAEAVSSLLNDPNYYYCNCRTAQHYYDNIDDAQLMKIAVQTRNSLLMRAKEVEDFIDAEEE